MLNWTRQTGIWIGCGKSCLLLISRLDCDIVV